MGRRPTGSSIDAHGGKRPRERRPQSGAGAKHPTAAAGACLPPPSCCAVGDEPGDALSERDARALLEMYYAIPERKTRERLASYIRLLSC